MPAIAIETSGYVLHARAWRETSLLLECFTPGQGRIGLVARGVRGARTRTARADLQPLRRLRLSFVTGGEMGSLRMAELETLHALHGEALLAALYVNELLVRLLARDDAHPRLFERYQRLLDALVMTRASAWPLRCFERDLLEAIGYAPLLDAEAETGAPLQPDGRYVYRPEMGPLPWRPELGGQALRGSALLALASGRQPDATDLADLRRLLRQLLSAQLGGRPLTAWSLASLARARPPAAG